MTLEIKQACTFARYNLQLNKTSKNNRSTVGYTAQRKQTNDTKYSRIDTTCNSPKHRQIKELVQWIV